MHILTICTFFLCFLYLSPLPASALPSSSSQTAISSTPFEIITTPYEGTSQILGICARLDGTSAIAFDGGRVNLYSSSDHFAYGIHINTSGTYAIEFNQETQKLMIYYVRENYKVALDIDTFSYTVEPFFDYKYISEIQTIRSVKYANKQYHVITPAFFEKAAVQVIVTYSDGHAIILYDDKEKTFTNHILFLACVLILLITVNVLLALKRKRKT